jgi:hypothetical protein
LCKLSCCKLCQKERVALLRHTLTDRPSIINDWSEIHGSCCHWARFHRGLTTQCFCNRVNLEAVRRKQTRYRLYCYHYYLWPKAQRYRQWWSWTSMAQV